LKGFNIHRVKYLLTLYTIVLPAVWLKVWRVIPGLSGPRSISTPKSPVREDFKITKNKAALAKRWGISRAYFKRVSGLTEPAI